MATMNDECYIREWLQRLNQDLIGIGEGNVWYGFLPCSVVAVFRSDRLLAFVLAEKNQKHSF